MTFHTAICDLYSDDFKRVESALSNSTFINDIKEYSTFVYCTGFKFNRGNLYDLGIDIFYDPFKKKLIHQCSTNHQGIPKYMGLTMWHETISNKHYYSPLLKKDNTDKYVTEFHYLYYLDTESFNSPISLLHNIKVIDHRIGTEYYIRGIQSQLISFLKKDMGNNFQFILSLGNEAIIQKYPYQKFYTHNRVSSNDPLKDFYKGCNRQIKPRGNSWAKLAEDELNSWDKMHPGWSNGLWN